MYISDIPQEQEAFTLCGGKRTVRRSTEQLLFTQVLINADKLMTGISHNSFFKLAIKKCSDSNCSLSIKIKTGYGVMFIFQSTKTIIRLICFI